MFNAILGSQLEIIPNILLVIGAIGAVVFAISYAAFFNWRKTSAGRALMKFVIGLITVFVINSIGTFYGVQYTGGEYPGRWLLRTLGYGYLVYTMIDLIRVLWTNWHSGNNKEALVEPKIRIK